MVNKIFDKLSPFTDLTKLWHSYLAEDDLGKQEIEKILSLLSERLLCESFSQDQILLKPPSKEIASGEFLLGDIHYGDYRLYPFGLRKEELASHIGIFGRSGSGKTTLVILLIWNLLKYNLPFLLFDWKQEYSVLSKIFPNVQVYFAGGKESNFSWNPLIPPNHFSKEGYKDYIKDIATLFVQAYFPNLAIFSLEGVKFFFIDTIDKLCQDLKTYQGSMKYPTFSQILSSLQKPNKSFAYAYTALKSCLQSLCFGSTNKIFNAEKPVSLNEFFSCSVILELRPLGSESDKRFFTNAMLYWLYQYRINEPRTNQPGHSIIMEEAHHHQGELLEQMFRMVRAFGECLVFIDQHPSLLSIPVFGNMYTTIALNLKHEQDVELIAKTLGLEGEERGYLRKLASGQAIIKLQGRYSLPFLIHFPKPKLPEQRLIDNDVSPIPKVKEDSLPILDLEEMAFLQHLSSHPEMTTIQRYKTLSLNPRKGNEIQKSLITQGFVENEQKIISKGRVNFLKLTSKAKEFLKHSTTSRHGGAFHQYAITSIIEKITKQGYKALPEYPIGHGKTVDVMLFYNDQRIAIEVETGLSDFANNIQKCLALHYPVIIVALNRKVEKQIQNWLDSNKEKISKEQVKVTLL